jgi:large subunit ribosomal protein L18
MASSTLELAKKRTQRNRTRLKAVSNGRLRLSVFRSAKNISAQIIDDAAGVTVAAASSQEKDLRAKDGAKLDMAKEVGALIAKRAIEKGLQEVVFDRGGYLFHGRVKALADAAREAGLKF